MRKALIIGIDHYAHIGSLNGCVNDARALKNALERNADGTVNFANPRMMAGAGSSDIIHRKDLKDAARDLFADDPEIALFYFAGHGFIDETGGFLCAGDCQSGDDGLSLNELMSIANDSNARNKVIILDSCHAGIVGNQPSSAKSAELREGMTILTASTAEQYAAEIPGGAAGVFTSLLIDALEGAAANLVGDVTPGSVYAHIDQSLGPWAQRPMFKTHVKSFVSLRKATPPIPLAFLRELPVHFPTADYLFKLDPAYEPERSPDQSNIPPPDPMKTAVFAKLQEYARVNLVRPVGAPHMWHAAMQSQACVLTIVGEYYRGLVQKGLI